MRVSQQRLKHLANVAVSTVDKHAVEGQPVVRLCNYTDVYNSDLIADDREFMVATASAEQLRRFRLRAGQTLITKDSETAEDIGVPAFVEVDAPDLVCGYHLAQITPIPGRVEPKYLYWAIASEYCQNQFSTGAFGVTRFGLRAEIVKGLRVPLPDPESQRRIVDMLDRESSRVDALIDTKLQILDRLEDKVDRLIGRRIATSDLVAGGLAGTSTPLGRQLRKLRRPVVATDAVTAFRDGQVTARSLRREVGYTESWTDSSSQQGVCAADVVVHGLDGFAGAIGCAEVDGACSPVYHVCQPLLGDPDYMARMLRLLAVSGYLELFASSTRERAVDFRNWDRFRQIPIPNTPLDEQRRVGDLIRSIRPLRVITATEIALLRERRHSLITAAITGEMEVP